MRRYLQRVVGFNAIQMRLQLSALLDMAAAKPETRHVNQLPEFGCPMDRGSRIRRVGSARVCISSLAYLALQRPDLHRAP